MNSSCSVELLESALAGELPPEREEILHRHLDECEACVAALEQMAGGEAGCREAAALLSGDELDDAVPARDESSKVDFAVEHLEPSDEPNVLGRLGGYDVLEIIGRGGMGVVLKGFDRELKRCVAIKVLAPHLAQSSLAKKRFTREAQAAAAVLHPNVLAIHQVQAGGRLPFLVMPLVAGESLAGRLTAQGRLELKETLRIGMQAAAGLAAAHEQGLVHRDVKPANILLEKGVERAVLTDFGLARAADDVSITRWGIIAGTPEYMSPEQALGEPLDGRSDLFSLGCVLYEMATGVSPFRADSTMATLRRLVDDPPPAMASLNPELPPWFIAIVDRLLQKDPSQRFGSAKEVSELLEGCLAHLQQPASVPLPAALPAPAARRASRLRNTCFKGTIAMIATLGIGLVGMFLMQATEAPDIAGRWSGEGWGQVLLTQTAAGEYAGTYSDTVGKEPGKIQLKWSRIERRFNGTWREGDDRFGELSIRLADHEIRGALTTDPKSKINPATPRLADLVWTRAAPPSDSAEAGYRKAAGGTGVSPVPGVALHDAFHGKFDLPWTIIRPDPSHYSLTKNPGGLTITTQRGTIHRGQGPLAKNIFLIPNPSADGGDFCMTLAVSQFQPTTFFHQVGLVCYNDDANYAKWSFEYSWLEPNTTNFVLVRQTNKEPLHDLVTELPTPGRFWMRITKQGSEYECAYSTDGREFKVAGKLPWGDGKPKYVGFLAKNGGNPDAPDIDVTIDSFDFVSPPGVVPEAAAVDTTGRPKSEASTPQTPEPATKPSPGGVPGDSQSGPSRAGANVLPEGRGTIDLTYVPGAADAFVAIRLAEILKRPEFRGLGSLIEEHLGPGLGILRLPVGKIAQITMIPRGRLGHPSLGDAIIYQMTEPYDFTAFLDAAMPGRTRREYQSAVGRVPPPWPSSPRVVDGQVLWLDPYAGSMTESDLKRIVREYRQTAPEPGQPAAELPKPRPRVYYADPAGKKGYILLPDDRTIVFAGHESLLGEIFGPDQPVYLAYTPPGSSEAVLVVWSSMRSKPRLRTDPVWPLVRGDHLMVWSLQSLPDSIRTWPGMPSIVEEGLKPFAPVWKSAPTFLSARLDAQVRIHCAINASEPAASEIAKALESAIQLAASLDKSYGRQVRARPNGSTSPLANALGDSLGLLEGARVTHVQDLVWGEAATNAKAVQNLLDMLGVAAVSMAAGEVTTAPAGQVDRYAVPQGGVPGLLKFIEDLSQYRPGTPDADTEYRTKFRPALQEAAEKILRLEKDPKSEACQVARFILLANRVRWFARMVPTEQRRIIADVKVYLAEQIKQGEAAAAADLARSAAMALQATGQWGLAADAYDSFVGLLQQGGGAALSSVADAMQSRARRLKTMSQQLPPATKTEISPKGKMVPLDLKGKFNWRSVDVSDGVWHGNGLAELPKGEQTLDGVRFRISDEMIQLGCKWLKTAPVKVERIPVNRPAARLYFLDATQYGNQAQVADGTHLADYKIHYADGSEELAPVDFGRDVRDWWDFDNGRPVTRGRVVWTGANHASEQSNSTVRLYLGVWENPHPEKPVSYLDFVCANDGPCAPFCMAITVEEPVGTR